MNYLDRFKVQPGTKIKVKDIDPAFKDRHDSEGVMNRDASAD